MSKDIELFTKVFVPEVEAEGLVYERSSRTILSDYTEGRVYGIRFSTTVWPKNFTATIVLHLIPSQFNILEEPCSYYPRKCLDCEEIGKFQGKDYCLFRKTLVEFGFKS